MARHDLRLLVKDPAPLVLLIAMPLVLMAFLRPAFESSLVAQGYADANGAEQAVPGVTVMFAFFLVGNVGFGFFREHGWNTWERIRASWARPSEVLAGKAVTPLLMALVQLTVLFGVGRLLFGLHVRGSMAGLAVVGVALACCLVALGFLLTAVCRTVMQMNAAANLGALVFAGIAGALAPMSAMPSWARSVAPVSPAYWAMRGYREVILDAGGVADVLPSAGVLLAFAAGFAVLAATRFRFAETKTSWA